MALNMKVGCFLKKLKTSKKKSWFIGDILRINIVTNHHSMWNGYGVEGGFPFKVPRAVLKVLGLAEVYFNYYLSQQQKDVL